jgi:hypothetical protein
VEEQAEQAIRRAQRLLHSLDTDASVINRAAVLAGLRHEVDTLAVLAGLPLQLVVAGANNPAPREDESLPFST